VGWTGFESYALIMTGSIHMPKVMVSWTETSKTMCHNKPFHFMSWFTLGICYHNGQLINTIYNVSTSISTCISVSLSMYTCISIARNVSGSLHVSGRLLSHNFLTCQTLLEMVYDSYLCDYYSLLTPPHRQGNGSPKISKVTQWQLLEFGLNSGSLLWRLWV
jgi:hypothetical protein